MAGLEALAMGIPLLAADNRGTREYVKPGINGYFCNSDTVQDWIDGLSEKYYYSSRLLQPLIVAALL